MSNFNFRQVTGSTKYRAWKDWKKGEMIDVKVESFSPNKKSPKFSDIVGKVVSHNFAGSDISVGDRMTLNGNTGLQKGINTGMVVGDVIRVVYGGQEIVKTGEWAGSKTHSIEVYIADKDKPDLVAEAQNLVAKAANVL